MGFFSELFYNPTAGAGEIKRKDLENFLSELRKMDGEELGRINELAERAAERLSNDRDIDPMHPAKAVKKDRNLCLEVRRILGIIERTHPEDGGGFAVWLHTFRAMEEKALMENAKEMWRILGAGREGIRYPEGFGPGK